MLKQIKRFFNPYYSQYGQDKYLKEKFFKDKKHGFFVEVGADDGIDKSNSLYFERIGWEGICVEASPSRFPLLRKNRKCHCVNALIANSCQTFVFNDYSGWGKGLSGIQDLYDPKHVERIDREREHKDHKGLQKFELQSIKLSEVFQDKNLTHIDFCSIDVEGAELEVVKSIDFSKVKIDVFIIENNYGSGDVRDHLEKNGYVFVEKFYIDDVYARKDFIG